MRSFLRGAFCAVVLLGNTLAAQSPYLVKDINTTVAFTQSSDPIALNVVGNKVVLQATVNRVRNLYAIDSITGSASVLPGTTNVSVPLHVVSGGRAYYLIHDGPSYKLLVTDGTAAGTVLLHETPSVSGFRDLGALPSGGVVFSATDVVSGVQPWITDGTVGGTKLLVAEADRASSRTPGAYAALGTYLYFFAAGGLWRTDGTRSGTSLVVPGITGGALASIGGKLYFYRSEAASGMELWTSDGTPAGTTLVKDIGVGAASGVDPASAANRIRATGGVALFVADDGTTGRELWRSDGTATGTYRISDIRAGSENTFGPFTPFLFFGFDAGSYFVFGVDDGVHGSELWRTDGTSAGTFLVRDLRHGDGLRYVIAAGGGLSYFFGDDGVNGLELWVSNGSPAGTSLVADAVVGATGSAPSVNLPGVVSGAHVFYAARSPFQGTELWVSDGTSAGTRLLANISPDSPPSSNPHSIVAADRAYVAVTFPIAGQGGLLYASDGTTSGTVQVSDIVDPDLMTQGGDGVYLRSPASARLMWRLSGGVATKLRDGTLVADRIWAEGEKVFVSGSLNGVFGLFGDNANGAAMHRLLPGGAAYATFYLGRLFFATPGGLWLSDGSIAGTKRVASLSSSASVEAIAAANDIAFILMRSANGLEVWKSDGAPERTMGTVVVPRDATAVVDPRYVVVSGSRLYFVLRTTVTELWVTDGTSSGTRRLLDVAGPVFPPRIDEMVAFRSNIFFSLNDGVAGREIWVANETGARLLRDVRPGSAGSNPTGLRVHDGRLWFAADDGAVGSELWVSDGTDAGTRIVADINPGSAGSEPAEIAALGRRLLFAASHESTGRELWGLDLDPAPGVSIRDSMVSESAGSAHIVVELDAAPTTAGSVAWSTADRSAAAGRDYVASSGVVMFAAGQRRGEIAVPVVGNGAVDGNRSFAVMLSDAIGSRIVDDEGFVMIEDDDRQADLSIVPSFSNRPMDGPRSTFTVTNNGPSVAPNVRLSALWVAPAGGPWDWDLCSCPATELRTGEAVAFSQLWSLRALPQPERPPQPNPQPVPPPPQPSPPPKVTFMIGAEVASDIPNDPSANNRAILLTSAGGELWLPAPFFVSGQRALVTLSVPYQTIPFQPPQDVSGTYQLISSSPAILSVPASATVPAGNAPVQFEVIAGAPGRATLTAVLKDYEPALTIDVVAPGTVPRFFTRLEATLAAGQAFGPVTTFSGRVGGRSAVTFQRPAGTVVLKVGETVGPVSIPLGPEGQFSFTTPSPLPPGTHTVEYSYAGNSEFLPSSLTASYVVGDPDFISITAVAPATAVAGTSFQYEVTAGNGNPTDALDVELSFATPSGTTLVSVEQIQGPVFSCGSSSGPAVRKCTIARWPASINASRSVFRVTYAINPSFPDATLRAVTHVRSSFANPLGIYDRGVQTVGVVRSADLSISADVSGFRGVGEEVTVVLRAMNAGPSTAVNPLINVVLSSAVSFVSAQTQAGSGFVCSTAGGVVSCTAASIGPSTPVELQIKMRITSTVPSGASVASVSASSATPDPSMTANTVEVEVDALPAAAAIPLFDARLLALLAVLLAATAWTRIR